MLSLTSCHSLPEEDGVGQQDQQQWQVGAHVVGDRVLQAPLAPAPEMSLRCQPEGVPQAERGVYSPALPCPWTQATFPGLATVRPAVERGACVCHVLVGEAPIPVQLGFGGHVRLSRTPGSVA